MTVNTIGVVGAGMMGSEIALVMALAGKTVLLSDREQTLLDRAVAKLDGVLDKGIARGFYTADDKAKAQVSLRTTLDLGDFAPSDMVIEAVFEDEQVKAGVYEALDEVLVPDCLIASNTSSISISVLASYLGAARRPRFLGTHFFSPVSRMKLVEVIPGLETSDETVAAVTRRLRGGGQDAGADQGCGGLRGQSPDPHLLDRGDPAGRGRGWRRRRTSTPPVNSAWAFRSGPSA